MHYTLQKEVTERGSRTKYYLYDNDKLILKLDLPFTLKYIADDIVLFTKGSYNDDDSIKKDVLFNLKQGKIINEQFNKIYPFEDYAGTKRAQADIYLKYHKRLITISCFIDIYGNIVSKIIDNKEFIPFEAHLLSKRLTFLYKCLEDEENQFNGLLQNEKEKVTKLILQKNR